jgi:AcrR family transcriptional regulator
MSTNAGERKGAADEVLPMRSRLVPTQQRSRDRYERILQSAVDVIVEKGSEAFRMSDVVERTGIAFGSLYQYFPDKTAVIETLAERYNAIGRDCVARDVGKMNSLQDVHTTLCNITDGYYQMFVNNPVMRDIWTATQADRALQKLDEEDGIYLAGLLSSALLVIAPRMPDAKLSMFSQLMMTLISAAVRHAILLDAKDTLGFLKLFKQMLPQDLSTLQ